MDDVLVLVEELDVFGDAIFEDESLGLVDTFIDERDVDTGIQECELAEALAVEF